MILVFAPSENLSKQYVHIIIGGPIFYREYFVERSKRNFLSSRTYSRPRSVRIVLACSRRRTRE